jgi:glycosyltransferase involved in cell wall biosynthesis
VNDIGISCAPPSAPRVVVIGSRRDQLSHGDEDLIRALDRRVQLLHVAAASPVRHSLRAFARASDAISHRDFEAVHILDPRFAPVGAALRRRYGIPLSVSLRQADLDSRHPWSRITARAFAGFDQAFASDNGLARSLRASRARRLPLSIVPHAATELPWPQRRDVDRVARALRGVRPGRLVVGVPWPENRNDFRWFRDLVRPGLTTNPVCLLFGVPSRREVKWMLRPQTVGAAEYRILPGRIDASVIAAIARAVDAFAVPSPSGTTPAGGAAERSLALAVGGAPIVSDVSAHEPVFAHEDNAFLSETSDERAFVATLDRLLALPAVQRHFLGEEFARFTLQRFPWSAVADVYADRFSALVGRPLIPAELRAA